MIDIISLTEVDTLLSSNPASDFITAILFYGLTLCCEEDFSHCSFYFTPFGETGVIAKVPEGSNPTRTVSVGKIPYLYLLLNQPGV
jgi:hypothetical protein